MLTCLEYRIFEILSKCSLKFASIGTNENNMANGITTAFEEDKEDVDKAIHPPSNILRMTPVNTAVKNGITSSEKPGNTRNKQAVKHVRKHTSTPCTNKYKLDGTPAYARLRIIFCSFCSASMVDIVIIGVKTTCMVANTEIKNED